MSHTSHIARLSPFRRTAAFASVLALIALNLVASAAAAATLANFPSSNSAIIGVWANPTNAYADDGSYALVNLARGEQVAHSFGTFGFDAIPVGSTINSVTVEIQFHVSSPAGGDTVSVQAYVSGAPSGSAATNTSQPTTDTVLSTSTTGITTRSQLLDGTFTVRVGDIRPASGGPASTSFSLDYVRATVDYTPPDTTPPVVTVPADMTVEATGPTGAVVSYSASATDDVDGALTPTCVPPSGSTFPIGATTVTCSATDTAGNTGSDTFDVTVEDTTPPTVTVPADISVPAAGPTGSVVTFSASAADLVDGAITPTCVPPSGSTFPIGTTTVTCSATDTAGNTGSDTFDVTVEGTVSPEPTPPPTSTESTVERGTSVPLLMVTFVAGLAAILALTTRRRGHPPAWPR